MAPRTNTDAASAAPVAVDRMSGGRSAPSALPGVPLVSIVTPCLNPGERLLRCIESVSAQGHGAIEHVVVDGGSTDGTIERLESDMRIRWLSEPDRGQAHAINKGFALATGSLLTWLNADDVLLPGAIEEVVSAVAADRRLGLVYGHCRIVEGGHEVLTWRAPRRLTQRGLEAGASIPQPGAFVSRWALEWIGGLDESFELAMDVDLWLRLLAAGVPNRGLGTIVSEFELHPGSKTVSIPRERFFAENARAFLLAGNSRGAALSAGQGAAAAATVDGHVDRARLRTQIGTAVEAAAGWPGSAPLRTIGAAARAEAAMIELRASPLALRHLLAVDIWRDRAIRRRVLAGMRRGAPRIARTLVRRPA